MLYSEKTVSQAALAAVILHDPFGGVDAGSGKKALNGTAYRIFKMLQWLMESPLSVEALNERFTADPLIARSLSSDSIWLYVNTLKTLGCRIQRPSPKNGFRYRLLSHPFAPALSEAQLELLARAKAFAQSAFLPRELAVLDGVIKKIVLQSASENPQEQLDTLFARSRSLDFEAVRKLLPQLEQGISASQLLKITYQSPVHGEEAFAFLPTGLLSEQGVLYLRGYRPGYEGPSSLRLDRLQACEALKDKVLSQQLLAQSAQRVFVRLQVLTESPADFEGFGLTEAHGIEDEAVEWIGSGHEVRLQAADLFYLRQRVLACPWPVQVGTPGKFREELSDTLKAMQALYEEGGGDADGRATV